MDTKLQNLLDFNIEQLEEAVKAMGQPKFRTKQLWEWLYKGADFSDMTNLPESFRMSLAEKYRAGRLKIKAKLCSKVDDTIKYLFDLGDGNLVESVLMKYKYGYSACVSTQVGCKMGCTFCASTKAGFVRNLSSGEILGQIVSMNADMNIRIGHVVLMGIGEPLDNYDNVLDFLRKAQNEKGLGISYRNISLSTCGLAEKVIQLSEEKLPITLSISLHSPFDSQRSEMMPVNRKYPLDKLLDACNIYTLSTGRRITYEYALIEGVNDTKEHAARLISLLKGKLCHVNLIPVNKVEGTGYEKASKKNIAAFQEMLEKGGVNATVRRTLGQDIEAACGQLRRAANENKI
ncbi:MAG: 23S rRNA (adenine(2503)-C(2))-methyltransferase RlmN [Clostridia bacterium]|jgi:23S rRNA (adenine2503-C2)-methyltransferase|nr:23S rRNA (adenine(2503)-C(2))-methyltransferase RlmN [Clostridia bacterium]